MLPSTQNWPLVYPRWKRKKPLTPASSLPLKMAQGVGDGPYPTVLGVKLPSVLGPREVVQG